MTNTTILGTAQPHHAHARVVQGVDMTTKDKIKAMNPETAAMFAAGMGAPLTQAMRRTLVIACRNGGFVAAGTGAYKGHVERISASSVLALIRRGLLVHCYGSEGECAGRLSPVSLARLGLGEESAS